MIFRTYTGNAMLNNALMTIQALAKEDDLSNVTPELLTKLYGQHNLMDLNNRLKSYTMLFTKNGPLKNDKTNGAKIYDGLFRHILQNFENTGAYTCEISGLKFDTSFEALYEQVLKEIGIASKEIQKKDLTINRVWFPLIGGLGSDAQALPQAKFSVQIHPICVVVMQFLPLSALIYRGGVLLIDSSNFEFAKDFIAFNTEEVRKRIVASNSTEPIPNISFNKGSYLVKAIAILEEKELEDEYSDLNLWSFSNSGLGASCSIDRVPNLLMKKLLAFKQMFNLGSELKSILQNPFGSEKFIEALEEDREWWLLYPNIFGKGTKKTDYPGVSVAFLEAYFHLTSNSKNMAYARYLSCLIEKYKTPSFEKYLGKVDAWSNKKEYRHDLFAVLVKATSESEWTMEHHFEILDDLDSIPLKNNFYGIHKLTHFYFQKGIFDKKLPTPKEEVSIGKEVCKWVIGLLQRNIRGGKWMQDLTSPQKYQSVSFNDLFIRAAQSENVTLEQITFALFDDSYQRSNAGMNGLLRIFFSQPVQSAFDLSDWEIPNDWSLKELHENWEVQMNSFANDYQEYYYHKYGNEVTGKSPVGKYQRLIDGIPLNSREFFLWFEEAVANVNLFIREREGIKTDKWTDDILYNPYGELPLAFSKLAIKFTLLKQHFQTVNTINIIS